MLPSTKKIFTSLILVFFLAILFKAAAFAEIVECSGIKNEIEKKECLEKQQEYYQQKIAELKGKANTLSNQIAQFNAQISLTETKIESTQEQILLLGGRIDQLELSLGSLTKAFEQRAVETYKMSRLSKATLVLFSSPDIKNAVSRYYYLQKIQEADHSLLSRLQKAQTTYKDQKGDLEGLQKVLGAQKEKLDTQKIAKANLLSVTKNDEKRYQELLAQAKAEYEAIQAIIAGAGDETEVGNVNEGDRIASIIQGASCNSSGSHVHFMVVQNGNTQNPFTYLKEIAHQNCSGPGECQAADPFNPTGSWNWPINEVVKFSQGYGSTWAVQNTWVGKIYKFHNGIDINNESDPAVKAVKSGTLYRGSYSGYNSCQLRYVRVKHDEGGLETYYLHINY